MIKIKFLPFVALTYAVSTAVSAGGDAIDASTSLVDSSDTAIVEVKPVVEALSLDANKAVEGLSSNASVSTVSAPTSALDSASALTDGQASGGFEAFEDEPILIDISSLLDPDRIGLTNLQWEIDRLDGVGWIPLSGANSPVFIPRQQHVGYKLRAQLSYTDGKGSMENLISPATSPVQNINDPPLGQLEIIGSPMEAKVLARECYWRSR